ncbi:MAG: succinyl-diaminopimelate desuccinylase [Hyphomicrobiaceae bacterium]
MTDQSLDPIALTQALVRCESVTPTEGGALSLIEGILRRAGFSCRRIIFESGAYPVDNLYASIGQGEPHLCFAGHTDVVPAGDLARWTHPPFAGAIEDGWLYGRGAVDMKGNIACFMTAALDYLATEGSQRPGTLSLLITGDEEADAVDGTVKVLDWMAENGQTPSHCIVGEPSCSEAIGDTIRIGRRGSLSAKLVVTGKQGHVGYAHLANNPIDGFVRVAAALNAEPLDRGTEHFVPSNLEIVSVDVGNPVYNVIPARIEAKMNVRFNDRHTPQSLEVWFRKTAETALAGTGLGHEWSFFGNADAFVTKPGPLVDMVSSVIQETTGRMPELSTAGGTSDARFVKTYCPVLEIGLVNKTIHAVDERVPTADLDTLTLLYRRLIERYFATFAPGTR